MSKILVLGGGIVADHWLFEQDAEEIGTRQLDLLRRDLVASLVGPLTNGWAYPSGSPNESCGPPASKHGDERTTDYMQPVMSVE
jgi:hypothetical protein